MADETRIDPVATPPRSPDNQRSARENTSMTPDMAAERDPDLRSARRDPKTGEVPAGPGDAGLEDRPERNSGSPGTKQMSNKRLGIGLGIAAFLAIIVLAVMF